MDKQLIKKIRAQIGEFIIEIRTERALTHYAVAKMSGLAAARIHAVEKGMGYNIDTFLKIIIALNCNLIIEHKGDDAIAVVQKRNPDVENTLSRIGKILFDLRKKKQLTYYSIMIKCGLSQLNIEAIEKGEGYTINSFIKLTRTLDCVFSLEEND